MSKEYDDDPQGSIQNFLFKSICIVINLQLYVNWIFEESEVVKIKLSFENLNLFALLSYKIPHTEHDLAWKCRAVIRSDYTNMGVSPFHSVTSVQYCITYSIFSGTKWFVFFASDALLPLQTFINKTDLILHDATIYGQL